MTPAERIFIALDFPSIDEARALIEQVGSEARAFKVGLQLYSAAGPEIVRELVSAGYRVFLDLKLHDIPNTVAKASEALCRLGVGAFTIHTSGGKEMMRAAVDAVEQGASGSRPPWILGVTLLTSLDAGSLKEELGVDSEPCDYVLRMARLAEESGVTGVISSPQEIAQIRESLGPDFKIVVPGIRPKGSEAGDQRRVATPEQAFQNGADAIVIGRPITCANDPRASFLQILDSCSEYM